MKEMKEALIEIWCELWEAIWRGTQIAVTVIVAIAIVFNVLVRKKDKPAPIEHAIHTVEQVAR